MWTFVLVVSALSIIAGVINTWIKARHGYPIVDEAGDSSASKRQIDAICAENRELQSRLGILTARLAVLERIATDQPHALAREIDALAIAHQSQPRKDPA